MLIAADLCDNFFGLGSSPVSEDPAVSNESIGKSASFDFDKAVFGHGNPLMKDANMVMMAFYEKQLKK